MADKSATDKTTIQGDAQGQFAKSQGVRDASGVASAKPTVITGSEDATKHKLPPGKKAEAEWSTHYDEGRRPIPEG